MADAASQTKMAVIFACALVLFSCVTKQVTVSRPEMDTLDNAMKEQREAFTECFNRNRAHGTVTLQFTLNRAGHMTNPGIASSTLKNPVADACVLKTLNDVNFPPHTGQDLLHIKYPLSSE